MLDELVDTVINDTYVLSFSGPTAAEEKCVSSDEKYAGIFNVVTTVLLHRPRFQNQAVNAGLLEELTSRSLIVVPQSRAWR